MEMWGRLKALPERTKAKTVELATAGKELAQDDPRRVAHSIKVGLAITLVSLFYYYEPLYDGFGVNAMWAVLTVIVVFEFSVGSTLNKGLNRGLATFLAGSLGFGAHHLASLSGEQGEAVIRALFVFVVATTLTFVRFFPRMKARYDYGLLMFILTFCLICVSGYRDGELLALAHTRISTILIGGFTAVCVCIFVCPVWAGDDLHNLVATNIQKLGCFLECFSAEFFESSGVVDESVKKSLQGYKSVLNSKSAEESFSNFVRWEPPHGRFRFGHPWKQYLKIGSLTRECAYEIEAVNGYPNISDVRDIKKPSEIQGKIQEMCKQMSSETGKALNDLAMAITTMAMPSSASCHILLAKSAADNLMSMLKTSLSGEEIELLGVVPLATVASLLVELVYCTETLAESVHELASLAKFKKAESKADQQSKENNLSDMESPMQKGQSNNIPPSQDHVIVIIGSENGTKRGQGKANTVEEAEAEGQQHTWSSSKN